MLFIACIENNLYSRIQSQEKLSPRILAIKRNLKTMLMELKGKCDRSEYSIAVSMTTAFKHRAKRKTCLI